MTPDIYRGVKNSVFAACCNILGGTITQKEVLDHDFMADDSVSCNKMALIQSCAAELIGSLIFTFTTCMVSEGGLSLGVADDPGMIAPVALCSGFSVAMLVASFKKISGAHFNPAVSVATWIAGRTSLMLASLYVLAQIIGSTAGAGLVATLKSHQMTTELPEVILNVDVGRAILCEGLLSLFMVQTYLMTTSGEGHNTAPVAVGFSYVVASLAGVRTTGGCINAATALGAALVGSFYTGIASFHYQYVFWASSVASSLVAGISYRFVFLQQNTLLSAHDTHEYTELRNRDSEESQSIAERDYSTYRSDNIP